MTLHVMNCEEEPLREWRGSLLSILRRDVLQSHKETTSDHPIVLNSIHIRPLGCWCISKACLGPSVVSSLLPKPSYCDLR